MNSQAAACGPPFFRRRRASRHLLACTAVLVAACATQRLYDGPPLPEADRAIVRADPAVSAGLPVQIRIRRVDNREVGLATSAVELRPGTHELLVDCRVDESGAVRRFAVTAELEAGGRYRLVAQASARNCEAVEVAAD